MNCITALRWIGEALRHRRATAAAVGGANANPGVYDLHAYPLELWSGPALAMFV